MNKYTFIRAWRTIRNIPREIKWFVQRGKHGIADCDWWSLDTYITDIAIKGIENIMYRGIHVGCMGGDSKGDFPLNDPEARRVHHLYQKILRFFTLHKLFMDDFNMSQDKSLRRKYKASGLLLIRNFGRLWD